VLEVPEELTHCSLLARGGPSWRRCCRAAVAICACCATLVGLSGVGIDLPSIGVDLSGIDLSGISRLKACTWGSSCDHLLLSDSSGSIGVFTLLTLRVCFSISWRYIRRDDQDLAI
jgi:hypothetical protein